MIPKGYTFMQNLRLMRTQLWLTLLCIFYALNHYLNMQGGGTSTRKKVLYLRSLAYFSDFP